jgi:hypothetical protein
VVGADGACAYDAYLESFDLQTRLLAESADVPFLSLVEPYPPASQDQILCDVIQEFVKGIPGNNGSHGTCSQPGDEDSSSNGQTIFVLRCGDQLQ